MKATNSMQTGLYFNSTLPLSSGWGETRQRIKRVRPTLPDFTLDADQLAAASKQEIICAVILALCLLYTLVLTVSQLAA